MSSDPGTRVDEDILEREAAEIESLAASLAELAGIASPDRLTEMVDKFGESQSHFTEEHEVWLTVVEAGLRAFSA